MPTAQYLAENRAKASSSGGVGEVPEDPTEALIFQGFRKASEDHRSDDREHARQRVLADTGRARSPQGDFLASVVRAKDLAKNIAALLRGRGRLRGGWVGESREMLVLPQSANEGAERMRFGRLLQEPRRQRRHDGFDRRVRFFGRDAELGCQIIERMAALGIS